MREVAAADNDQISDLLLFFDSSWMAVMARPIEHGHQFRDHVDRNFDTATAQRHAGAWQGRVVLMVRGDDLDLSPSRRRQKSSIAYHSAASKENFAA